ncbi:MAG: BatA domain-containing protein [Roseimicrobium sp.]
MNFLFPFFALAAAAIAIPILLHFRRQPPQKSVPFSSLMFLEQTPVPPRTKRKLEDWLLLLLRCLALILLALMFARPLFKTQSQTVSDGGTHWCFLVDVSASMQRGDAWEEAQELFGKALEKVREEHVASIVVFDQAPRVVLGREAWESAPEGTRGIMAASALQDIEPSWGSTDLGKALLFATQQLSGSKTSAKEKRIVLISDIQDGASLEALHAASWPADVAVTVLPVEAPWRNNLTLSAAATLAAEAATEPSSASPRGDQLRVRITSTREATLEKFSLAWRTGGERMEATVPSGGNRIVPAPARSDEKADGMLELHGDALDFDNHLFVAQPQARSVRVLCVGRQLSRTATASPLFYLTRALKATPALSPVVEDKDIAQLQSHDLAEADIVFAFGEGPAVANALLRDWAQRGGALVCVAEPGDSGALWREVLDLPELTLTEASGDALLQDLRFDHPLLSTFAESGVRDFTKVRFWKHRVLEAPEAVMQKVVTVARFDDDRAAWVEFPNGKGRVLLMTSGWQPADSQLAVSSKFVPMIFSTLDWALGAARTPQALVVGDGLSAKAGGWQGVVNVTRPDRKTVSWDTSSQPFYTDTDTPGIYVIGSGAAAKSVAVNLAPSEGRLAPIDVSRLSEAGVTLHKADALSPAVAAAAAHRLEDSEQEQRQKAWKFLLLAAFVVLLLETWLAGRRGAPSPTLQPT